MRYGETTARRLLVTASVISGLILAGVAAGAALIPSLASPRPQVTPSASDSLTPTSEPTLDDPSASPSGDPGEKLRPAHEFAGWAQPIASRVEIPQAALESYGYAEYVLNQKAPACKLQWTTIAAIGKVETDHGRSAKPPIIGPQLTVPDTDGGALDGDKTFDHLVGPMQFLPTVWRVVGVDADADLLADPQNLDDAALSVGYFLCGGGKDLSVPANWEKAVQSFHDSSGYARKVFDAAQSYGTKSRP